MTHQEAKQLIDKYLQGDATPDERQIVENWYNQLSTNKSLSDSDDFEHLSDELWQKTLLAANLKAQPAKTIRLWPAVAVAASVSLFLLIGIHLLHIRAKYSNPQIGRQEVISHEILPGGNKAMLILANGKQLSLAGKKSGQIAKEHNAVVRKTNSGEIQYVPSGSDQQSASNMLVTPRGGQYSVVLADGTKVTLNAASSLRYPTNFNGSYRDVELTGEAYFEVAHNPAKPFRVKSKGQMIEVLGTHFNINCYDNEPYIKTTLLQGSVKVTSDKDDIILKPGQQSRLDVTGAQSINVADVNTDESVAWKNGLFQFNASSIEEVMRDAERWYDVDVTYTGKRPGIKITGSMSRNVNFSGFVKLLEFEGVKFNIQGHKVVVTN